ncbi:hypothetical protein [Bartonella sp. HY038]|nr:hypothetical protein [Bartonella sp. HY038]
MVKSSDKQAYLTLTKEQKAARKSRALGIMVVVLLLALLIYIATYAKFGG